MKGFKTMASKNDIAALLQAVSQLTATVQAQSAQIEELKTKKGGNAKKGKPARPEGLPVEPSSFKVPGGGPFGVYIPDGWAGISKTGSPPTDQAIPVNKRDRSSEMGSDGLYPISDTRYYVAGSKGWARSKKDGGWVSYFPRRVEVETDSAESDFDAAIGE